MPTIDDFIRPKEWVSEFVTGLGKVVRQWGPDRYVPIRQDVDEDWRDHRLITPLMKEVLVDLGVNAAFFPVEAGGTEMPEPVTISAVVCEELAHRFGFLHCLHLFHLGHGADHAVCQVYPCGRQLDQLF